jgi:hypothetical protein
MKKSGFDEENPRRPVGGKTGLEAAATATSP